MLYSVDGGRALVGQAARIDPKHRQKISVFIQCILPDDLSLFESFQYTHK